MAKGNFLSRYSDFCAQDWSERSWTECLEEGEALGGPSPFGSSKWQDFKDCPYLYELHHIRRFRRREWDVALEVGGLFHEALARYFQSWVDGEGKETGREKAFEIVTRCYNHVPDISSEVQRLLTQWMGMYHGTRYDFRHRVLAVECLVDSAEPVLYSARLDLVLETETGGIELMDHKTARQYTANMLMSYRLEPQFLGHMYLWEASGRSKTWGPLERYTVDLITKTREPTIELVDVPVIPRLIQQWKAEMVEHWKSFQRYKNGAWKWPRRTGYQCRFCKAFEHCASGGENFNGWIRKAPGDY
jgi:hypothetical protein